MVHLQRRAARLANRALIAIIVCGCLLSSACAGDREDSAAQDAAADSTAPVPSPAPDAAELTPADFERLRFLEGEWRGTMPNGVAFYESYRFLNDSTIQMYGYSDSTFTQRGDSARIELRNRNIANESGTSRSVVVAIDATGVHFVPEGASFGPFTFMPNPDGSWTATLQSSSGNVVYHMKRVTSRR